VGIFTGAVAWINDDSSSLDEIILTYGAHLVLSNYTTVSQILSDGSNKSVVHVLPKAKLKISIDNNAFIVTECDAS
jgi:hypothetical protein